MNKLLLLFAFMLSFFAACNEPAETPTKGSLTLYADESVIPLMDKEKDAFTSRYPETSIKLIPANTEDGIEKLLKGNIGMFISSRNFTSDEQGMIVKKKIDVQSYGFCYDGIAVITSRKNILSNISSDELKDLLLGKSSELKIYLPSEKTGIYEYVKDDFLDGQTPAGAKLLDGDKEIKDAVKKQLHSIGLTGINLVKDTSDLKIIPIGVLDYSTKNIVYFIPHPAYFLNGEYPLKREIYIFLNDKSFGVASGFTSFLTSTEGQKVVLAENLAPASVPVKLVSHK